MKLHNIPRQKRHNSKRSKVKIKYKSASRSISIVASSIFSSVLFFFYISQSSIAAVSLSTEAFSGTLFDRTVVALFDSSSETKNIDETRIHKYLELPLNHLGYKVTYWDINRGFPSITESGPPHRIVTWFDSPLKRPNLYIRWLSEAIKTGTHAAILGHAGVNQENLANFNVLLRELGLKTYGNVVIPYKSEIQSIDSSMLGFEHPLPPILPGYPLIQVLDTDITSHLSIRTFSEAPIGQSAVVTTGSHGGFAPTGFVLFYEPTINRVQWILNPFAFFEAAFGDSLRPIPDVTTISGRRLYFSHIDGDGWNNPTEISPYSESGTLSSEVVLRELIAPYPDMPVSVGLIAGDADPELGAAKDSVKIAQELFRLPQVEVATHSYSHPYDWEFFENYKRDVELEMLSQVARESQPKPYQKILNNLADAFGLDYFNTETDKYISGSDALPRTYMKTPFDLQKEIKGALEVANSFAPEGKHAALYQWSGNTNPFAAAIRMTREADVRNINGGDSRFDAEFPSLAYVPPIARTVDSERQIYAVNSNENTYTNDWSGPYYAQRFLSQTLKNTERPRRLKGINVYYHMYTGEKPASLRAVKHHIETARSAKLIPIKASEYAALADSFFSVEIRELGPIKWSVNNRGSLQTIRFDNAENFIVSLSDSQGVIGQRHYQDSLYITLDPAITEAIIALKVRSAATPFLPPEPELVDSRWQFSNLVRNDCALRAQAFGFGRGEMTWRGLKTGKHRITVRRGSRILWQQSRSSTAEGLLRLEADAQAISPVEILIECEHQK